MVAEYPLLHTLYHWCRLLVEDLTYAGGNVLTCNGEGRGVSDRSRVQVSIVTYKTGIKRFQEALCQYCTDWNVFLQPAVKLQRQ